MMNFHYINVKKNNFFKKMIIQKHILVHEKSRVFNLQAFFEGVVRNPLLELVNDRITREMTPNIGRPALVNGRLEDELWLGDSARTKISCPLGVYASVF